MQVICKKEWIVEIGDRQFTLTKDQIDILKKASTRGYRGIVWFDKFAISIPHIQYIKKKEAEWIRKL